MAEDGKSGTVADLQRQLLAAREAVQSATEVERRIVRQLITKTTVGYVVEVVTEGGEVTGRCYPVSVEVPTSTPWFLHEAMEKASRRLSVVVIAFEGGEAPTVITILSPNVPFIVQRRSKAAVCLCFFVGADVDTKMRAEAWQEQAVAAERAKLEESGE